jgi:integrase
MKGGRVHRVPLSAEALVILDEMAQVRTGRLIFPGRLNGRPLSIRTLVIALRTADAGKATTHGCRSTFKDWCAERTSKIAGGEL